MKLKFHVYCNGGKWGEHSSYREAQAHAMREIRRRVRWDRNIAAVIDGIEIREVWIEETHKHTHKFTFQTIPKQTQKMLLKHLDARDITKLKLEGKI